MTEAAPELTPELLADSAWSAEPVISPDGRLVAYTVSTVGVKERRLSALWVVAADASSPPVRLTAGTAWDRAPRWAPDSASLFFLSDRQLCRIRPDGAVADVLVSPQDEPGAFTARLHVVDPGTGKVRDLGSAGLDTRSPTWWSAGGQWHLAYLVVTPPGPVGGLAVVDVLVPDADAGGAGEHRNLTAGMTVCPVELAPGPGGSPLALFADGLDTALHRLDASDLRFRPVSAHSGRVDSLTASSSGEKIAARVSTAYQPKDIHAGPVGGRLVRLSDTQPELRRIRFGTQERLSYQACDGLALDGLLILPVGKSRQDGPFPLVTLVHGGPYDRYADDLLLGWWPTPVLILHGQDDTNVPIGQAIYFQRALSQFGVEHEFVVYPREGHPILERNHQIDLLQRTRAWFARWLGNPAPS